MLPVQYKRQRPRRTFLCSNISKKLAKVSLIMCIMTSLVTFIVGLTIGLLLPPPSSPVFLDEHPTTVDETGNIKGEEENISNISVISLYDHIISKSNIKNSANMIKEKPKFSKLDEMIQNNIFWSDSVEKLVPKGFSDNRVKTWANFSSSSKVVRLENGCGRMQNRKIVFENGSCACCRYRHNNDQIQGEIFSFYLSRILKIHNVPPSSLSLIRSDPNRWSGVRDQVSLAQWSDDKPVVMTTFIDHVVPAYIPKMLRKPSRHLNPTTEDLVEPNFSIPDLAELVQWTDLIIFDYLTANLDRVVNNMFNEQWNPDMMSSPAHNLVKEPDSGLLVFIDNESGLLHGYRLLDKYDRYHRTLLNSVCVFRKSTAEALAKLSASKNIGKLLKDLFSQSEPEISEKWLDNLPVKNIKMLNKRILSAHEHIEKCKRTFDLRYF